MWIPWKEIYFSQEIDSRRTIIKEREVAEMDWQLIYKHELQTSGDWGWDLENYYVLLSNIAKLTNKLIEKKS